MVDQDPDSTSPISVVDRNPDSTSPVSGVEPASSINEVQELQPIDPFMINGKFAQSVRDALKASYDRCSIELIQSLNTKFNNNNIIVSYDGSSSHVTVDGVTGPL